MKRGMWRSGRSTMRCTSKNFGDRGRIACTTTGPMVMFGTKWPSITSTWIQSAPARVTASTSSPSRLKSADRIEGATSVMAARRYPPAARLSTQLVSFTKRLAGEKIADGEPALALELQLEQAQAPLSRRDFEIAAGGAHDRARRRRRRPRRDRRAVDFQEPAVERRVRARPGSEGPYRALDLGGAAAPVDRAFVLPHHRRKRRVRVV